MSWLAFTFHLLGFAAPAVWVGLLATVLTRLIWRGRSFRWGFWGHWLVTVLVMLVVLVEGLVFSHRDGAMLTYGLLVLAGGVVQWWAVRRR